MTARRLRSFRQGDLAEGLGREMLRRFAAVASVPREEDFGLDAICTLLRPEARMLFAENTFAVQIKAASADSIEMSEAACKWLHTLDVPVFLVRVDLKSAAAEIYSYDWAVERPADLEFHPGPRKLYTTVPGGRRVGTGGLRRLISNSDDRLDQRLRWLGPPVCTMTLADLTDDEQVKRIRTLLKAWCEMSTKGIHFRRFGINFELTWETNKPPRTGSLTIDTMAEEAPTVFDAVMPLLLKAEAALAATGRSELNTAFLAIKRCADDLGVLVPGFSSRAHHEV